MEEMYNESNFLCNSAIVSATDESPGCVVCFFFFLQKEDAL